MLLRLTASSCTPFIPLWKPVHMHQYKAPQLLSFQRLRLALLVICLPCALFGRSPKALYVGTVAPQHNAFIALSSLVIFSCRAPGGLPAVSLLWSPLSAWHWYSGCHILSSDPISDHKFPMQASRVCFAP